MTTLWDSAIELKRLIELERKDAARIALEAAAQRLECYNAGEKYQQAFKLGARLLRGMSGTFVPEPGTDNNQQLSDTSEASR
jgi:hypothetical protein